MSCTPPFCHGWVVPPRKPSHHAYGTNIFIPHIMTRDHRRTNDKHAINEHVSKEAVTRKKTRSTKKHATENKYRNSSKKRSPAKHDRLKRNDHTEKIYIYAYRKKRRSRAKPDRAIQGTSLPRYNSTLLRGHVTSNMLLPSAIKEFSQGGVCGKTGADNYTPSVQVLLVFATSSSRRPRSQVSGRR